jgi:hypothetical protein
MEKIAVFYKKRRKKWQQQNQQKKRQLKEPLEKPQAVQKLAQAAVPNR